MSASGEQAQHPSGIGRIARFAENSAIHYDDSIRPQNEIIRTDAEHSLRFFTCHAFGEISGKLAFLRDLRNIRWLNDELVDLIARGNGADALSFAEILRAVGRCNVDSFERSESSLD